jgi:hypothetical protein
MIRAALEAHLGGIMFLAKIWGPMDEEILVDMHLKRPEPQQEQPYLKVWMSERIKWGKPFLCIAGILTVISIITMIAKHL